MGHDGARRLIATICGALVASSLAGTGVRSHPHVWISVGCAFVFDGAGRPTGVVQSWTFDEMYSPLAVMGAPHDRNGRRSPEALTALAATIVSASRPQGHFTTAVLGAQPVALSEPTEIGGAWGADQKLTVRFRMDFREAARQDGVPLRVEVHDTDLFADFQFSKEPQTDGLPPGCAVRLDDPAASLPSDPQAVMDALINGPLLTLASGIELA